MGPRRSDWPSPQAILQDAAERSGWHGRVLDPWETLIAQLQPWGCGYPLDATPTGNTVFRAVQGYNTTCTLPSAALSRPCPACGLQVHRIGPQAPRHGTHCQVTA